MEIKLMLEALIQETVQQALLEDLTWWQGLLRFHARKSRRDHPERRRYKSLRANGTVSLMLFVAVTIICSNERQDLK